MSEPIAEDWTPSPALLAAYADGKLDEDGPQAALCRRLERWLARNPARTYAIEEHRQITEWYRETAAEDPGPAAWGPVMARLRLPVAGQRRRWARLVWRGAGGVATAACLWLALTVFSGPGRHDPTPLDKQTPTAHGQPVALQQDAEPEIFPVATAAEVEILSVKGEDTTTVVVGELPVEGPLPLLQANEVIFTRIEPARDNMVPEVRRGGGTTFVWAPLDAEREDPEEPN